MSESSPGPTLFFELLWLRDPQEIPSVGDWGLGAVVIKTLSGHDHPLGNLSKPKVPVIGCGVPIDNIPGLVQGHSWPSTLMGFWPAGTTWRTT